MNHSRQALLLLLLVLVSVGYLTGCADEPQGFDNISVTDEALLDPEGDEVLSVSALPSVSVDEESDFDAADRFLEATVSPDGRWLAFTSSGVSHGAGWLIEYGSSEPKAVAFQYGGSVTLGSWSESGRYLAFTQQGPAGDSMISVADRQATGDDVASRSSRIESPGHDDQLPEERRYEAIGWEGETLYFEAFSRRWSYEAESGRLSEAD